MIEFDGSQTGSGTSGLGLPGGSTLRGLVINRFDGSGANLGGVGNVVEGNYIGTDPEGLTALGNGHNGISVGGSGHRIGGFTSRGA